ncbi:SDR family NAD(P)-dependent oxidoreductase [Streptomyces radicis]|uniref:SDR family NAD(P)-dependent oxidoreductase n=1 Tax=Streptomyces radicis TaxID=1750517 RepID=A0A3A9VU45_9ACTN|nr:type I polyketide synthase [Streptomyces radicis]RKN03703.1 SDR family NAD(P)-dependent oxidoreductase [Streptomyces radicis]RKN13651.1 SDR family NAD(P)-dependent oxidoreductase [Streptomyces radicis]
MTGTEATVVAALRASVKENKKLRRLNRELTDAAHEPIAIVAMGCRFPGGVASPDELWRLLAAGEDALVPFPDDRGWDLDALTGPDTGGSAAARGGFLSEPGAFDPAFFGISPREALAMDPQQRLLLETSWEAFERAGIDPATLRGSATGVFMGTNGQDYAALYSGALDGVEGFLITGTAASVVSGRLAYTFGLQGPAVTVDTACSASLVTLHLAAQALRRGECDLALAGGATVMATPTAFVEFGKQGGLAPDGRCKAFAAAADGTGWGEGVGVLLVERLSDARRNGHPVLAVVRGSAVNQDGASNGLTAPSGPAQQRVIRAALADAGLTAADIDAVEAHGTGTTLGDPIEAQALQAVYGQGRAPQRPLWLGSVKSNLGHTQAAAGVAGVIKMVLALRHGTLPATLHVDEPTPAVDWDSGALRILTEPAPWDGGAGPRRAGVSSFGVSGTNAHVILEQAPETAPAETTPAETTPPETDQDGGDAAPRPLAFLLSARSAASLRGQAGRLRDHLAARPGERLADIAHSLASTRSPMEHRAALVARDRGQLLAVCEALAAGNPAPRLWTGRARRGRLAFLYTGQGSQWPGMGAALAAAFPAFADALDEVTAHIEPRLGRPLRDPLTAAPGTHPADALDGTDLAQPTLFAFEVALTRLLASWGVRPDAVLGHSLGGLTAAHVAGVLTLPDACALVVARGRLMASAPGGGAMAAIEASEPEIAPFLTGNEERVSLAAVNGPTSVVVSGDAEEVGRIADAWRERGRKTTALKVSHAFHSPHLAGVLEEFAAVARGVTHHAPTIPLVSDATGALADPALLADPDHWVRHMRGTVRFADAIAALHAHGVTTHLEVGPDGVLSGMGQACLPPDAEGGLAPTFVPTVLADGDPVTDVTTALARLHTAGRTPDLAAFHAGLAPRRVPLPTYAFTHDRYWLDAGLTTTGAAPAAARDNATQGNAPHDQPADPFAGLDPDARQAAALDLLRRHIAAVLGHADPDTVEADAAFSDLGFTSLTAVELRNSLVAATGVDLPASLVFDHPTARAAAAHLAAEAAEATEAAAFTAAPGPHLPRAAAPRRATDEPIAIVGMACRYPGGVRSPEDLWRLLADEGDGIGPFPEDRGWDLDALYHPDPEHPGTAYTREGGFLTGADLFDAAFFGINPREALAMDPQQRQLLEVAWEAVERAGIAPTSLRGSDSGVFVGAATQDYGADTAELPDGVEGYLMTGNTGSVISGRLSYVLGLEGPSLTVDTACSASLTALHLACRALRADECSLALAGGVMVMPSPTPFVAMSKQRGLAEDGRCKPFDASADGTGFSEGVGVLVVERLSDARRNGHPVLAVVRGSAVNQDGASNGLTAPNGPSQQRVIRAALTDAGLRPGDIDAVEAHGTGTTLGDPIEAQAVISVYGRDRAPERPLWLGSSKSNLGHSQAAAGVAGVIKMVLALRHGTLPATLHLKEPTPHVDWSRGAVSLLATATPWPETGRARRAGVSSFGVSGTNAHVLLEEPDPRDRAPEPEAPEPEGRELEGGAPEGEAPVVVLPVSARTEPALRAQAATLAAHLRNGGTRPLDIAHSLAAGRATFARRAAVTGRHPEALAEALTAVAEGRAHPAAALGTAPDEPVKPVFVFPGQGSQWPGMAAELLDTAPAFAERFAECRKAFEPYLDWSLEAALRGGPDAPSLERLDVVQPALFTVMVCVDALWRAHGVRPAAVLGHSQGEIAAAHVAGALTLDEAARMAALRSQAYQRLAGTGAMGSVLLPPEEIEPRLAPWQGRLSIAAVNSPCTTVVSGDPAAVEGLLAELAADGAKARRVAVTVAGHSPHVEVLRHDMDTAFAGIEPRPSDVPFCSSVTGEITDTAGLDAAYWFANLRQAVRFDRAAATLMAAGHHTFIEMSPHPALGLNLQEIAASLGREAVALGSLRRGDGGLDRFLAGVAEAHAHGVGLDLRAAAPGGRRVDVPTYAWQGERFWLEPGRGSGDLTAAGADAAEHPLLGARVDLPDGSLVLTGRLAVRDEPWLADHAVAGTVLLPGAGMLELALRAGAATGAERVDELTLHTPLVLPERGGVQLRVVADPADATGRRALGIHTRRSDDEPWLRHADGVLAPATDTPADAQGGAGPDDAFAVWPPEGAEPVALDGAYERLAEAGYDYGPAFRGLAAVWRRGAETFAEVRLDDKRRGEAERYGLHPAALDAALHAAAVGRAEAEVRLPFSWTGVALRAVGAATLRVRLADRGGDAFAVTLADAAGRPVLTADALVTRPVDVAAVRRAAERTDAAHDWLYETAWTPLPRGPVPSVPAGRWAALGDIALAEGLQGVGVPVDAYRDLAELAAAVASGTPAPELVLALAGGPTSGPDDLVRRTHAAAGETLALVRDLLADGQLATTRLALLTRGGAGPGDAPVDPAAAALWGLARSAQSENPGRLALLDIAGSDIPAPGDPAAPGDPVPWRDVAAALALADEPQLALRGGTAHAPRLATVQAAQPAPQPDETRGETPEAALALPGTALVTGGTGTLGRLVARHLVTHRGTTHLLLVSRAGERAEGAAEFAAEMAALGAAVTTAACDVADRDALARLIDGIPPEHPLTAVVHAAGVLDDGLAVSLTPDQLTRVLRPKVDAAVHLDQLTEGHDLRAFVLFSSASGTFGGLGQANYAAANAFLDALATRRRSQGRPATSLAWGTWAPASTMTDLTETDLRRMARGGVVPLSAAAGLELLDLALAHPERPVLVPVRLDLDALAAQAEAAGVPVPGLFRGLVRPSVRRATLTAVDPGVRQRVAALPEGERLAALGALVREQTATVLGHGAADAVDPAAGFGDLGFDSLTSVELRNRLSTATGLTLPPTLVFDHPTPADLAERLHAELAESLGAPDAAPTGTAPGGTGGGSLLPLFRGAVERGEIREFVASMDALSRFRPAFDATPPHATPPHATPPDGAAGVRLAGGDHEGPLLLCLPPIIGVSGPHQYARFAAALRGRRTVIALPHPGFRAGEPVAATPEALARAHAETALRLADGTPFALVGYSSGGFVAHAVAEELQARGTAPDRVVLLDSYPPDETELLERLIPAVIRGLQDRGDRVLGGEDDAWLTAMGRYMSFDWTPSPVSAPTLLVRSSTPLAGLPTGEPWRATWKHPHRAVDVPGDHFTMMEAHADAAAEAVEEWLAG